ncbi:MAG: glycosyltransferase family 4 protein [Candidatus Bathyarchaeota archaeon]|nr:glycosyltransferase family 4 protein [Candidatus Bathyarchaeota archaeon]
MRVCFIVPELFAFKKFGGYGNLVRIVARELQKRGVEVCAVTWREPGQRPLETVEGITVLSYPYDFTSGSAFSHALSYRKAGALYRLVDADVYHSIEASVETYLAERAMPHRKHVVHFQDPYLPEDHVLMSKVDKSYTFSRTKQVIFYANRAVLKRACKKATALYTQANYYVPRVQKLYDINREIGFLPNPVTVPNRPMKKASEPTVCFLGRWDPQKRVELFLELAKDFPNVKFIALGRGTDEQYDLEIRQKYRDIANLSMPGFVTDEVKSALLEKSWIMISTSIREGLPLAFLEALAHKTAILSSVNPDNLASKYGLHVSDNEFGSGLKSLLEKDLWANKGEEGYRYVRSTHEIDKAIDQYIVAYQSPA